jgi:hypothetical protein
MKMTKMEEEVSRALEVVLDALDGVENREEKKNLLMALIVTVYEEVYNNANPLPIVYSERLN